MALIYLWKYNGSEAGLQYTICRKLSEQQLEKIEFLLPQICHLIIFNEIELPSLEHLLLTTCHQSLHAAVFTLWFLEYYLEDLRGSFPKTPQRYLRTLRLLSELQRVLFKTEATARCLLSRSDSSSEDIKGSTNERAAERSLRIQIASQLLPTTEANIVGAGIAFAGLSVSAISEKLRLMTMIHAKGITFSKSKYMKPIKHSNNNCHHHHTDDRTFSVTTTSVEDLHTGSAFSLRDYINKAAKQMQINSATFLTSPVNAIQGIPNQPPPPRLYYFPEMQFIMSLVDTSSRLVTVPKDGRLKALTAELALINHNLPASICLPFWCTFGNTQGATVNHHRILRICPTDSVVLNSAERVPFLVLIEILEGEYSDAEFQEIIESHLNDSARTILRAASHDASTFFAGSTRSNPSESSNSIAQDANNSHLPPIDELTMEEMNYPARTIEDLQSTVAPLSKDDFTERMRTAAIMLAQLTRQASRPGCPAKKLADIAAIKDKIIHEMEQLEKNRLLDALQNQNEQGLLDFGIPLHQRECFDHEDPSAVVFQETFAEKVARIKPSSPYGSLAGWKLLSIIVKAGSDMRQEQLACQIISEMTSIWQRANLPLWAYSYRVLVAASNGGLIETVPNAISLHSLKKNAYSRNKSNPSFLFSLRNHFIRTFGSPDSESFQKAKENFMFSLAAYSIATYILQIKDRHDGNILLDSDGHLIHIDYGFMLSNSPGYVGFESAPFKISQDYIDLLGGFQSEDFARLKDLIFQGFLELRKHSDRIFVLIDAMQSNSQLPCFYSGEAALTQLRQRFYLTLTDAQLKQVVDRLVISSAFNIFTKLYDSYQYYYNGIF